MRERRTRRDVEIGWVERLVALRSFLGWSDLPASELALLSAIAVPRQIARGEALAYEGRPATSVFLLVEGEVSTRRRGREIGRLGSHQIVGAVLAFSRDPDGFSCVATEDAIALELAVEDLEDLFEERTTVLVRAVAEVSRQTLERRQAVPLDAGYGDADPGAPLPFARPLDQVERITALRANRVFARARIDGVAELARIVREVRYEAGETLFRLGEPSGWALAPIHGRVECSTGPSEQRWMLGHGDLVGGLDTMAGAPRWYEAVAHEPLVGLAVDRDPLIDLWEDHPILGVEYLRALSRCVLAFIDHFVAPTP